MICAAEFEPVNAKHHLCEPCQVIRDLSFTVARRRCNTCGAEFWPAKRSWRKCPACVPGARREGVYVCGSCDHDFIPAPGLAKTCVMCVQSSADMARRYLASLLRNRGDLPEPDDL